MTSLRFPYLLKEMKDFIDIYGNLYVVCGLLFKFARFCNLIILQITLHNFAHIDIFDCSKEHIS